MKKITALKAALILGAFIYANNANSAGFALYEFSARGNAMGGSVIANKAEPASIAMNPALITQLDGTQVQVGATVVVPSATTTFMGTYSRELESSAFFLPNFYITHKADDRITFGLAGYSRFGLGGKYEDYQTWPASAMAYKVNVQSFSFVPEIAVKATDEVSVAMGLEAMILSFEEQRYGTPAAGLNTKVSGSNVAWGGNFGVYYKPHWAEKWGFGATYKTKMRQVINGSADVTAAGSPVGSTDVQGSVTLPDMIMTGVSYTANDKLVVEGGVTYTFWSAYDAIRLIDTTNINPANGQSTATNDIKNYKDSPRFNIGAEYALNENWDLRAGYVYDISPINRNNMDTLVPLDDRHIFNIGAGYHQDNWGIDASYAYLIARDLSGVTTQGYPIKYTNGSSQMFGLTLSYKFK